MHNYEEGIWKKYAEYKRNQGRIETNRKLGRPDDYDGPLTLGERWSLDDFGSGITVYHRDGAVRHPNGAVTSGELYASLKELMALKFPDHLIKEKSYEFCSCGIKEKTSGGRDFAHKLNADWFKYVNRMFIDSELIEIRWDKCDNAKLVIWDFSHRTVNEIADKIFLAGRNAGELLPKDDTDESFAEYDREYERLLSEARDLGNILENFSKKA